MPLQATSGAASYDAFGGGVPVAANYIEDVFQTWLYTGNSSTRTINNGIDLAGKGGLVWIKGRTVNNDHFLFDTNRGVGFELNSNTTEASTAISNALTNFDATGFTLGTSPAVNNNNVPFVSWTFREQPKCFDCVTWTGNDVNGRQITHNLGSTPGCIMVKSTSLDGTDWVVHHRSLGFSQVVYLNSTVAAETTTRITAATSTTFTISDASTLNSGGATYVAYLFAHNAGGFGLTGTDNVISCGSYTGTGSSVTVDLGYEPQWILTRNVTDADDWFLFDNMRGIATGGTDAFLRPNLSNAENTASDVLDLTATGFKTVAAARHTNGKTYIYIAIRRGPMRTPTTGTSVFSPNTQTGAGTSAGQTITTNFPVDLEISSGRNDNSGGNAFVDRLRGGQNYIQATNTNAEVNFTSWTPLIGFANNTGITDANYGSTSASYVAWNFRRAPGFFDEVCATTDGNGVFTGTHNLGVVPELIITKPRNAVDSWWVYAGSVNRYLLLDSTAAEVTSTGAWGTAPTSTTFTMINGVGVATQVAYLFASCPGVSKVGSYTGTGTTQTINCGFTGGARFVLIKATSTTGNWLVWDSARGIVAGNDPYLALNSTAAEVTNTDWVDTAATGFELSNNAGNLANSNGVSYIFLAIA